MTTNYRLVSFVYACLLLLSIVSLIISIPIKLSPVYVADSLIVIDHVGRKYESTKNRKLVSFVVYAPLGSTDPVHTQCISNLNFFLKNGIEQGATFIFTLIHDTQSPPLLQDLALNNDDIHIIISKEQFIADPYYHGALLHSLDLSDFTYFAFLNCGVRGPYINRHRHPSWLQLYIDRLQNDVVIVGATINCEKHPHVQSFALVMNPIAASIAREVWSVPIGNKDNVINSAEVGLSSRILSHGKNIAALNFEEGYDFRNNKVSCNADDYLPGYKYEQLNDTFYNNPTACRVDLFTESHSTPGCRGLDPCKLVFIKNGGDILKNNLIPSNTLQRITQLETYDELCNEFPCILKPDWNVLHLSRHSKLLHFADIGKTGHTHLVLIIRFHLGFLKKLFSMLWFFESSKLDIVAVLVPTDKETCETLKGKLPSTISKLFSLIESVKIMFVVYDNFIYEEYGLFLNVICSEESKRHYYLTNPESAVERWCGPNSPLHYLLVDIAIQLILDMCSESLSCKFFHITNADNSYSPHFFEALQNYSEDIIIFNTINKGVTLPVRLKLGEIDLGSFVVRIDFLRRSGATFLSSLPFCVHAKDYHDADGYFAEALASNPHKSVRKFKNDLGVEEYVFFHH